MLSEKWRCPESRDLGIWEFLEEVKINT